MEDIKIVVDTGSDIPFEIAEKYNIGVISFLSIFGDEQYVHRKTITNDEFYEKLEAYDGIPTTSQTPYGDMYDYFKKECAEHKSVIYFALSGAASGQFQTANVVKAELLEENPEADFHIVDTQKFSLYIAKTAVHAAEMVQAGKTVSEILSECEVYVKSWRAYLLVDTLKYLEKGGRLSKTAALVGTMLDIKPILTIENGLVESMDKLRGKKKLIPKLLEKIDEDDDLDRDNPEFLIVHSGEERLRETCELLEEEYGAGCITLTGEFGPLIGTHVGKDAIAVLIKIKQKG